MSANLEQEYRRVLRWYPSSWRENNADAVVGTLLDAAEGEGRSTARLGEKLNLAGNGLLARIGLVVTPEARERAANFALGTGSAFAVVYFFTEDWMPWVPLHERIVGDSFGPFASAGVIVSMLWFVASVSALLKWVVMRRIALALSAAVSIVLLALQEGFMELGAGPFFINPDRITFVLLTLLAVVALIGTPRNRLRLITTVCGWGIALSLALLIGYRLDHTSLFGPAWYDYFQRLLWQGIFYYSKLGIVLVAAIVVAWILAILKRETWSVAIIVSCIPWAGAAITAQLVTTPGASGVPLWTIAGALVATAIALVTQVPRYGKSAQLQGPQR